MTTAVEPKPTKQMALPQFTRTMALDRIERGADGKAPDTIRIALSSEYPVERMDWFGDRWTEVLDHSKDSVDLSRFKDRGIPFRVVDKLGGHYDGVTVGIVEDPELRDGKLYGTLRFGRSALAVEARDDMLDGIRPYVSIGYRVKTMVLEKQDEKNGDTYRATAWEVFEASNVPVPADPSVGVGRAEGTPTYPVEVVGFIKPAPSGRTQEVRMENGGSTAAPPAPAPAPGPVVTGGDTAGERKRASTIARLAHEHGMTDKLQGWLDSDRSVEQVSREILDTLKIRQVETPPAPEALVDLSAKDRKRYSVCRAILGAADGDWRKASFEREVSDAIADKLGKPTKGIYLPTYTGGDLRAYQNEVPQGQARAGLDTATATKGQELKFTEPRDLIELLRNRMFVMAMGAQLLNGLQGNIAFPRQTGAGTATWTTENPGSDVADSNLLLNQLTMQPRTLISSTSYSRQLLIQSVVAIENLVRNDLALINALAIDLAAINGTGAPQPTGILNTGGVTIVAFGANGAQPIWDNWVDLETNVASANADLGALGYLTSPGIRGRAKKTAQIAATTGIPIWYQNEVNGYRAAASMQVPQTLTKGTATTCHAILFGNWNEVLVGEWGAMELIVDPYRLKKQGMIEVTSFLLADVGLRHAASFAVSKDALP